MMIRDILRDKNMTVYQLAKKSGLPYATVNDICNNKTRLEKCSAGTVYLIARALNVSMDDLIAPCLERRGSFDNFRSTICHRVKEKGDIDFVIEILESDDIRTYARWKWYPECLYLLGMVDYLSRENHAPLDDEYDDLRHCRLEKTVYPSGLLALAAASGRKDVLTEAEKKAIPEFMRFNIVEDDIRDVA